MGGSDEQTKAVVSFEPKEFKVWNFEAKLRWNDTALSSGFLALFFLQSVSVPTQVNFSLKKTFLYWFCWIIDVFFPLSLHFFFRSFLKLQSWEYGTLQHSLGDFWFWHWKSSWTLGGFLPFHLFRARGSEGNLLYMFIILVSSFFVRILWSISLLGFQGFNWVF